MPRYELSGEFFWTIELSGTDVTTGVGKIGSSGHTRVKSYKSSTEAKKQHDALIAEKVEQGYALVGEAPAKPARPSMPQVSRGRPAKGARLRTKPR